MSSEKAMPFIFYLLLEDSLPRTYYVFDRLLRDLGFILVPVKADQLQSLASSSVQSNLFVIASVSDAKEYRLYSEKVRGLLKFLLRNKRIAFMHLCSFSKLNDFKKHTLTKNYFFLKYPLDARALSAKIARYHDLKMEERTSWPGGKRAGIGAVVV